ncbi:DUF3263 domain-containing protein [Gulosibacter macacae]|uniref:DUF3263 domain-containing protein n=1 Tax=Gulosibacter macacae TaxID=2488791 RepID=A0A3P3VV89_9MICO|nr:DUF3263 domain-containing protein [Gulosibacter macacae]RRJ85888.1 DUF3263 domain-containing protein [Gulosibacter macacae]
MLTDQEKAILDLEERMPVHSSHKGDVIRAEVGLSVARYYQALHVLVDHEIEARREYPEVVTRLERARRRRVA